MKIRYFLDRPVIYTLFQGRVPCWINKPEAFRCVEHKACILQDTGWRVEVKKFLWFKYLRWTYPKNISWDEVTYLDESLSHRDVLI